MARLSIEWRIKMQYKFVMKKSDPERNRFCSGSEASKDMRCVSPSEPRSFSENSRRVQGVNCSIAVDV